MIVYRVEHPTSGMGPYSHRWDQKNKLCSSHGDTKHPGIYQLLYDHWRKTNEDIERTPIEWWSACVSRQDLAQWFDGWWDDLKAAGFVVVAKEINPDYAIFGKYGQVIYHEEMFACKREW